MVCCRSNIPWSAKTLRACATTCSRTYTPKSWRSDFVGVGHVVPSIADLAGEQAERFDLGIVSPSGNEKANIRSLQISPVALRFQTEHPTGALPTVSNLTEAQRSCSRDYPSVTSSQARIDTMKALIMRETRDKGCAYIALAIIPVLEDPFKSAKPMPELFTQGWQRAGHPALFLNSPTAQKAAA
jgi:hypothetical protein